MLSSTVFVVDVSCRMRQPVALSAEKQDGGTAVRISKLEIAVRGVQTICQFLTNHLPWETVTLYVFSDAYRLVFPPGSPGSLHDSIDTNSISSLVPHDEAQDSSNSSVTLLALLGAVRAGSLQCRRNTAVFVFTDLIRDDDAMKTLRSYPEKYRSEVFLPLLPTTSIAVIDLCEELWPETVSDSLLKFLVENHQTTKRYTVDPSNLKPFCDKLSKMIYAPWKGYIEFAPSGKDCVCIFPNPWGLGGARQHEKAPDTINLTSCVDSAPVKDNCGWLLPVQAAPELWHSPNGCDPSVPVRKDRWSWNLVGKSAWKPSYDRLSRNFGAERRKLCGGTLLGAAGARVTSLEDIGFSGAISETIRYSMGNWVMALDYDTGPGSQPRQLITPVLKRACDVSLLPHAGGPTKRYCVRGEATSANLSQSDSISPTKATHFNGPEEDQQAEPRACASAVLPPVPAIAATERHPTASGTSFTGASNPRQPASVQDISPPTSAKAQPPPVTANKAAFTVLRSKYAHKPRALVAPLPKRTPTEQPEAPQTVLAATMVVSYSPESPPPEGPQVATPAVIYSPESPPPSPPPCDRAHPRQPLPASTAVVKAPHLTEALTEKVMTHGNLAEKADEKQRKSLQVVQETDSKVPAAVPPIPCLLLPYTPPAVCSAFPGFPDLVSSVGLQKDGFGLESARARRFGLLGNDDADEKPGRVAFFVEGFKPMFQQADVVNMMKSGGIRTAECGRLEKMDDGKLSARLSVRDEDVKVLLEFARKLTLFRWSKEQQMLKVVRQANAPQNRPETKLIAVGPAGKQDGPASGLECKGQSNAPQKRRKPVLVAAATPVDHTDTLEGKSLPSAPQNLVEPVHGSTIPVTNKVGPAKTVESKSQPSNPRVRRGAAAATKTLEPPASVSNFFRVTAPTVRQATVPAATSLAKDTEAAKTVDTKGQLMMPRQTVSAPVIPVLKPVEPTKSVDSKHRPDIPQSQAKTVPALLKRGEAIMTTESLRQTSVQVQPEIPPPLVYNDSSAFQLPLPTLYPAQYPGLPYANFVPPAPFIAHGRPFLLNPMFNPFWRPPGPFF